MNNRILVTGGAGFIGSHLVERLASEGLDVVVLDNLRTGDLDNIRAQLQRQRVRFVKGDILNYRTVKHVTKGIGSVVHLAGVASVGWSTKHPSTTHETNATGTLNVLRASVEAGCNKMIFASSCAVYGNPLKLPIKEDQPTSPLSPYAASKLAAEGYVRAFANTFGLESTCLRLFNVYGSRQAQGDNRGVIAKFATRLARGIPPVVYGDGEQRRDFVYVEDVVGALIRVLEAGDGAGGVYNIGSGKAYSVNQVLNILGRMLNKNGIQADYLPAQSGEIKESVADISKATRQFGYRPAHSLEEGLRLTVQEVVAHPGK